MSGEWKIICELTDKSVLGLDGLSSKPPRKTARAIVLNAEKRCAVIYAEKFHLYSLPGGGIEEGEDEVSALVREVYEETGCTCDTIEPLGIVSENRYHQDYTALAYYFVVHTKAQGAALHLTEAEERDGLTVKWCYLHEALELIQNAEHETNQKKFLQARDVAALKELERKRKREMLDQMFENAWLHYL